MQLERDKYMWQNYVNAILGLWVILGSYLYVPSGGGQAALIVTGLVMAVLGFWGGATVTDESGRHSLQH